MTTRHWLGTNANWTTSNDWTGAVVPGSGDDVVIDQGDPQITNTVPKVHSLTVGARLDLNGSGQGSVATYTNIEAGGGLYLDAKSGTGGAFLTIGGALINNGTVQVGSSDGTLSQSAVIVASSIVNNGQLSLYGNTAPGVTSVAALALMSSAGFGTSGHLAGTVRLSGSSFVEFGGGGQITTIDSGADLSLDGAKARIADGTDLSTNSALKGLAKIVGEADLMNGATLTTSGGLTVSGSLLLDATTAGGSKLTINGKLTNGGTVQIGNKSLVTTDLVKATSINNLGGELHVMGGTAAATLNVDGNAGFGVAGHLRGFVDVENNALISFNDGVNESQIATIDSGATLVLNGPNAFVADQFDTTWNSALYGLTNNAGTLLIVGGAAVEAGGDLMNSGTLVVANPGQINSLGDGHAALQIDGTLTNTHSVQIYGGGSSFGYGLDAENLKNLSTISLSGTSAEAATLEVLGQTYGSGGVIALDGHADANFGGSVAAGQTIALNGDANRLSLAAPEAFGGAITGFGLGDTLSLYDPGPNGQPAIVTDMTYGASALHITFSDGVAHDYAMTGPFTGLAGNLDPSFGLEITTIASIGNSYALTGATDFIDYLSGTNTVSATTATLNAGDSLHGGSGSDTLSLSGGGVFDFTTLKSLTGFETVATATNGNYTITTADADVATGKTLAIDASTLGSTKALVFDGSSETNGAFNVTGGAGKDQITTGAGNDVLTGGAGADTMTGGGGNDTYYVDDANDQVIETAGDGTDRVHSTISYTLGDNVENLTLDGTAANATGNALDNILVGNASNNTFTGGAGKDTITGAGGADHFEYTALWGKDTITDFGAGSAAGHDTIDVSHTLFADYATMMAHAMDVGANAVISYDASNTITLSGVHTGDLAAANFKFT